MIWKVLLQIVKEIQVYIINVPSINTNDIHYVNNYMYMYH